MRLRALSLFGLTMILAAAGQDPLNRDTPQSAVAAFLDACRAHDYRRACRYIDMRNVSSEQRMKEGQQLAQELEEVLEHDVHFDLANLSKNAEGDKPGINRELVDTFSVEGKKFELQMERITLRSGVPIWVFASDTVDEVPKLSTWVSDSPVERHLPEPLVHWTFLRTPLWRWIALLVLIVGLTLIAKLIGRLTILLLPPLFKRFAPRWNPNAVRALMSPIELLLVVVGFRAGMGWINPAPPLHLDLQRIAGLVFFSALAWLAMRIVDLVIVRLRNVLGTRHQSFSYSVLPMGSRAVKIVIVALAITAVLSIFGYNTATILAGLGVGGIALALAAQKTVENLFGGVAVITDRPVNIGDFCKFGDQVGTVEDIGLRSTRIRTPDRTLLTVPNGLFSSMTLENFSQRDKMWFHLTLNLRGDTTSDQVRKLLDAIGGMLTKHPKLDAGSMPVRFAGVGKYSLDLEIAVYVATTDGDEFNRIQQELFLWILDEVEAVGTSLALPYAIGAPANAEGKKEPSPR